MDDKTGAFTRATGRDLESNTDKPGYLRYQHELLAPHVGRSLLEVGAGTGEVAALFTGLDRLIVTDLDPEAVKHMAQRFAGRPEVEARVLDLDDQDSLDEPVDSVLAVNVLEHIEDDVTALRELAKLTVPGGNILLWVPGYQQLYGDFDARVGHYRRYTPSTLASVCEQAGLTVTHNRPANLLGGIAWWAVVGKGGTGSPKASLVKVYDKVVVPITRTVERRVRPPFGQSVLCVARTPS